MQTLVWTIYISTLLYCLFDDVKNREIHLYALIVLGGSSLYLGYIQMPIQKVFLLNMMSNILFLGLQYLGLMIYLQLRYKEGKVLFKKWIGIGDLLFFLVILPKYDFSSYLFIYLGCLIFTVIIFLVYKTKLKTIPLAGLSALFIVLFECYQCL